MSYTEPVISNNQDKFEIQLNTVAYDNIIVHIQAFPSLNPGAPTPSELFQEIVNLLAPHYDNIYAVRRAPAESVCTPDEPEA